MIKKSIFIALFICLSLLALSQPSDNSLIDRGRKAYKTGKFDTALEAYKALEKKGYKSFALFYNLGNTYFKLKDIPHAILYYERAKKLNSSDEDLLFNLQLANTKITDKVNKLSSGTNFAQVILWLNTDTWALGSFIFFLLFLISLLLFLYVASAPKKRALFSVFSFCLLFSVATAFMAYENQHILNGTKEGIVFESSTTVKSAPGESGNNLFIIHKGLKVAIIELSGKFAKIKLADGNVGWIPRSVIKKI